MKKLWQLFEKLIGFYRWHPSIALRYLPIVDQIHSRFDSNTSVLEVGSSGIGIAPYLRQRVVGVDISFSPPLYPDLIPVKASATEIPFADKSFPVVISTDMLEHIVPKDRALVISEMLRVSEKLVCLGTPCGAEAMAHDEKLKKEYKQKHGKDFPFLIEQVEYGVPMLEDVITMINQQAQKLNRSVRIHTLDNMSLNLRLWLMRGWMSDSIVTNIFFRKILLLAIPILRKMNRPPTYRKIFVVDFI